MNTPYQKSGVRSQESFRIPHSAFRIGIAFCALWWLCLLPATAQIHLLGRQDQDKFLAKFWGQQLNASNLVVGVNANAPAAGVKWVDALLPDTILGRTLSGTFTGTNTFTIRTYDTVAGGFQSFLYDVQNGAPNSTNTISRVGFPETLKYKTANELLIQNGGTPLDGILRANGASYVDAITGLADTNRIYLGTNYFTFVDGVLTGFSGNTNFSGAGITTLNGLSGVTQTFATNSSGTDFNISSSGTAHTFNIPTASASARGLLSAANWSLFNSKQPGNANLTALAALADVGVMIRAGSATFLTRAIVGTNGVAVQNGNGLTGDIIIDGAGTNSPLSVLTSKGDLLSHDGTNLVRIAVGADGQVLAANSATLEGVEWIDAAASSANPTASVGLSTVNGTAATYMRSDAAPGLSVAIAPTWTGGHIFDAGLATRTSVGGGTTVNLTADNALVYTTAPMRSYIRLSSDNATAANRTFVLQGGSNEGQRLVLEWIDATDAAELIDDSNDGSGHAVRLNGNWTPVQYETLTLIYNGTDWIEEGRSPGPSFGTGALTSNYLPKWNGTAWVDSSIHDEADYTRTDEAHVSSGFALAAFTINLTADDSSIFPYGITTLSSDNATASNRTFLLQDNDITFARESILKWTGGNAGELLNTGNVILSAAWTPVDGDILCVRWDNTATKWREQWRYPLPAGASGANPTASVGLTAVNGVASTFLRSDGAPALSQSIAPTWTGQHTFIQSSHWSAPGIGGDMDTAMVVLKNTDPATAMDPQQNPPGVTLSGYSWDVTAGPISVLAYGGWQLDTGLDVDGSAELVARVGKDGTGGGVKYPFRVSTRGSTIAGEDSVLSTSATDGFFYFNRVAGTPVGTPTSYTGKVPLVYDSTNNKLYAYNSGWQNLTPSGASGANPTASVGLTAVNGVASTFLRSDGAPALSQSIAPTWTGIHTFDAAVRYGNQTNTYGASITIDLNEKPIQTVALTGDLDIATTNRGAGRSTTVRLIGDSSNRNLTFNASIRFVGAKPTEIVANKIAILTLASFGSAETDTVASYAEEP